MTGYFYTDPLAAGWMGKHFGMRFVWPVYIEAGFYLSDGWQEHVGTTGGSEIHSDSLHLLEPQLGDVLYHKVGDGVSIEELSCEERAAQTAPHIIQRGGRIIQRNGIAFMWPESEIAANP